MAIESTRGASVEHAGRVLRPVAWTLALRLPGRAGGLVWSRPLGVEVEEGSGKRLVPVPDRTRQIQWLLVGAGLAVAFLLRRIRRRHGKRRTIFER